MPADTCTSVDFLILSPFAPLHRNYRQDERLAGDRDCVECINVKHTSRASNAEKHPPGHGPEGYDENEPAAVGSAGHFHRNESHVIYGTGNKSGACATTAA
jgi:hypothetical protein